MGNDQRNKGEAKAEEAEAHFEMWKYVLGFTEMAVVKCAIDLGIAEVLELQENQTMSLQALSSSLGCSPSSLHRIMRFLTRRRIFKQLHLHCQGLDTVDDSSPSTCYYAQTPLSRLLRRTGENSMAALVLLESTPVMLSPWQNLNARVLEDGGGGDAPFNAAHSQDLWGYTRDHPGHSYLLNEAMACRARMEISTVVESCPEVFDGIGTLVDVGGGDGTALRTLIRARGEIRGINYDLPHVVSVAPCFQGIEHVEGDFFQCVPKADAVLIMSVLHDWGDDECIKILKNCKEAVPPNTGKVIILDAVIDPDEEDPDDDEEEEKKKVKDIGLMLDMVMMAHTTTGKERTAKEWAYVLNQAGFSRHTINRIQAVPSVIQAYP